MPKNVDYSSRIIDFFNIISLFDIRKRKTLVTNKYLIDTQYKTLKLDY